eukprot:139004-Prorocentrum_minimum.AAC.1
MLRVIQPAPTCARARGATTVAKKSSACALKTHIQAGAPTPGASDSGHRDARLTSVPPIILSTNVQAVPRIQEYF